MAIIQRSALIQVKAWRQAYELMMPRFTDAYRADSRRPANETRCYKVSSFLIGWAQI